MTFKQITEELRPYVEEVDAEVLPKLEAIAKEILGIDTLKQQYSDDKDFHEVSVWSLELALFRAYNEGLNERK